MIKSAISQNRYDTKFEKSLQLLESLQKEIKKEQEKKDKKKQDVYQKLQDSQQIQGKVFKKPVQEMEEIFAYFARNNVFPE